MIDIFEQSSGFTILSYRTMDFISQHPDKNTLIDDLTLRFNRDTSNLLDRIYKSFVIFDNDKYSIYEIVSHRNDTLYAKKIYTNKKKINNVENFIKIVRQIDDRVNLPIYNDMYAYTFFSIKYHRKMCIIC
jgi:hypothetical protein